MRKVIAAIIFGLLLSSNAYGSSIWGYLNIGMTKKNLKNMCIHGVGEAVANIAKPMK